MKAVFKLITLQTGKGASIPTAITATSGSGQSANCGAAYATPLVATITPALSGVSVTFTAPATGPSGTFASTSARIETVVTGADGKATSSVFTAGSPASGAYNVVASAGALTCNFALTNIFLPTTLANLLFWYKADSLALNDGDAVGAWTDGSANAHNLSQSVAGQKPLYKTNILNGKPGVLFDNADDCLASAAADWSAITQLTIYAVFTAGAGANCIVCELGTGFATPGYFTLFRENTGNKAQFTTNDGTNYSGYQTTDTITTTPKLAEFTCDRTLSTNECTGYINQVTGGTRPNNADTAGGFSNSAAINVGSRNNGASLPLNGYVFEIIAYSGIHDAANRLLIENYINQRWALFSLGVSAYADNAYTAEANRSDGGTFIKTSPGARLVYTTDAETAYVDTYNDIYSTFPTMGDMGVRVNGADVGVMEPTALGSKVFTVSLGAGAGKTVEFIAGLQSGATAAARTGSYVCGATFNKAAALATVVTTPRIVAYGDSITVGANSDNPSLEGWCQLVRDAYAGSLVEEARGFRSLFEDCPDAAGRTAFAAHIATLNPTIVWLAIGTNDYGGAFWTAANFGAAYADLLDKLHAVLPSATLYAQTPIHRSSEGANAVGDTCGAYRTAIADAVATRGPWSVLIDGTGVTFPQTGDLSDGVHPTTAGHAIYAAAVKTVLGI